MRTKKYGLIEVPRTAKDWIAGGVSGIEPKVLVPDGNWYGYLPSFEHQSDSKLDTMACVTFSALNCIEGLFNFYIQSGQIPKTDFDWLKATGYLDNNNIINFSDRYIAKLSGTTPQGNSYTGVGDAIRKYGLVPENFWKFNDAFDWNQYYSDILPSVISTGQEFLTRFKINYEFVQNNQLARVLQSAPIQAGIYAWTKLDENGAYTDRGIKMANHAVTLWSFDTQGRPMIFDSYDKAVKVLVRGYNFGSSVRYSLNFINSMPKPTIKLENNCLVNESEKNGEFGIHIDGKILVASAERLAHLETTWIMLNTDFNNKKAIGKKDWDSFSHKMF